jgi:peptidoglycan/LPS O-acetylase OafA/YrhL
MVCKRLLLVSVCAIISISPFLLFALGAHNIDVTHDFGAIRCIYGFATGVLCFNIYKGFLIVKDVPQHAMIGTLIEVSAVIVTVAFVQLAGHGIFTLLLVPLIFALPVTVFARERGVISKILCCRPMVSIGSLSYSIYMTHFFVQTLYPRWRICVRKAVLSSNFYVCAYRWQVDDCARNCILARGSSLCSDVGVRDRSLLANP